MKYTIVTLIAFAAVASASNLAAPALVPAAVNTGSSSQYRSQDNLGQYAFGYDEAGATGGTFRHEKSDAFGNRIGSYGLRGADGRVRIVNYVADANGYRASVQTNEPGTESRDTAGVAVNKALVAAPVAVAAPIVGSAPLPVPIAAAPAPLPVAPVAAPAPFAAPFAAAPFAVPVAAPIAAPIAAPVFAQPAPLPLAAAPVPLPAPVGFGYNVINHHFAPLPAY